ncbi:lactonase family protein [Auraticoccus monumenti]|uniref:6-phosphogluconolactonase, cycloisomerase 2 family n=1 Tax=Auraticoccus monumenti TaxID=675864 RepID=A0A1G7DDJ7_9ACTN|nr:beta-propeller fold lactonase family protein [Auraticoccus monumenti]SDE48865.1 6-phosphogluconolactonase, cycloisomerase 2 family [Auraticoccus monumenti]
MPDSDASGPDAAETTPSLPVGSTLYVGGYSGEEAQRVGVEAYRLDAAEGTQVAVTELPAVPLHSPSYLVRHPDRPLLYAVSESDPTTVSALEITDDGELELLNTVVAEGSGGCHVALDETGRFVLVAHYGSGGVSTFAIAADGRLSEQLDSHAFSGSGADPERQDAAHAHQVVAHHGRLLVCDLGTDQVHQLRLDPEGHLSVAADPVVLPAGSGPRHLVVTDHHLVVACELSGRLWLARREGDQWVEADHVPATSADTSEAPCAPSALRLDGGQVVVGNRGPDTFAVFDLDTEEHRLVPVAEARTGGAVPRDLILSPTHLWVANQDSDTVVAHRRPAEGSTEWVLDFEIPTAKPTALVLTEEA